MFKRVRPILLLLTVLALVGAACGGDDPSGDPGPDGETVLPGDQGTGLGDSSTLPTAVGNIPGVSGECEAYANLSLAMANVFTGGFSGFDGDLVSQLPSAGQADGAIIVSALQQFSDGLAAAGIDLTQGMTGLSADQIQVFSDLTESVFTDEVDAALDRLSELIEAECAIGADF